MGERGSVDSSAGLSSEQVILKKQNRSHAHTIVSFPNLVSGRLCKFGCTSVVSGKREGEGYPPKHADSVDQLVLN